MTVPTVILLLLLACCAARAASQPLGAIRTLSRLSDAQEFAETNEFALLFFNTEGDVTGGKWRRELSQAIRDFDTVKIIENENLFMHCCCLAYCYAFFFAPSSFSFSHLFLIGKK